MALNASPRMARLPAAVFEYFVVENRVASTPVGQVFKALDKSNRDRIGLLITRSPVRIEQIEVFASCCDGLAHLGFIRSFGLDAYGIGFAVLPVLDGHPLTAGKPDVVECERRFLAVVRLVAKVHDAGMVCGDLCVESFLFARGGSVRLLGGFGAILNQTADGAAQGEQSEWSIFRAPEQRAENASSPAVDVFALGVIAARLFTGDLPRLAPDGTIIELSPVNKDAPGWVAPLLAAALRSDARQRLQSASQLLSFIADSKDATAAQEILPKTSSRNEIREGGSFESAATKYPHRMLPDAGDGSPNSNADSRSPRVLSLVAAVVSGVAAALLVLRLLETRPMPVVATLQPIDVTTAPGPVEQGVTSAQLKELEASEDPLAHELLVRMFKDGISEQVGSAVWEALLSRALRHGLVRTTEFLREWGAQTGIARGPFPNAEPFLRLLDASLPTEQRREWLQRARQVEQSAGRVVSAALALDLGDFDGVHELFMGLAAEKLAVDAEELAGLSSRALMIFVPEVFVRYGEELLTDHFDGTDPQLVWSLRQLVQRGMPGVRLLAQECVRRRVAPDARLFFLKVLSAAYELPVRVQSALVAATFDEVTRDQLTPIAEWFDPDAEKVLWATVLIVANDEAREWAFDVLASRSIASRSMSNLYDLVRSRYYQQRMVVSPVLAALALEGEVPEEVFERPFEGWEGKPEQKILVEVVLKGPSGGAIGELIQRYPTLLDRFTMLELTKHPSAAVRAIAVSSFADAHDIVFLKVLADNYAEETDSAVRAVYQEKISVIRERMRK